MSTTHTVTLANTNEGAVHGHAAGCADLKRGKAYSNHRDEQFEIEVATKRDAWLEYNADFIAEGGEENAYTVEWLPCADHVPAETAPASDMTQKAFLAAGLAAAGLGAKSTLTRKKEADLQAAWDKHLEEIGAIEPATAEAAPAVAAKPTKAELIAVLVERGTHHRPALTKMSLSTLQSLVDESPAPDAEPATPVEPAPAVEPAAAPAKGKRAKNAVVTVDGFTVQVAAWCVMHDSAGKRIAAVRREAVGVLAQAVVEKQLRVMTEYQVDSASIGWVKTGVSLASVAKVLKKAIAEVGK